MKSKNTPWGRSPARAMLGRGLSLSDALRLMPGLPGRWATHEELRTWYYEVRHWVNGPLYVAQARHAEGLDERVPAYRDDTFEAGARGDRGGTASGVGAGANPSADGQPLSGGQQPVVLPAATGGAPSRRRFTTTEVAKRAQCSVAVVRKAVCATRAGIARPGDRLYLPRARHSRAGFRLQDVDAWIRAREGIAAPVPGSEPIVQEVASAV